MEVQIDDTMTGSAYAVSNLGHIVLIWAVLAGDGVAERNVRFERTQPVYVSVPVECHDHETCLAYDETTSSIHLSSQQIGNVTCKLTMKLPLRLTLNLTNSL